MRKERSAGTERLLNDVRQAFYSIRNHIERNFGAKEQEYITDEFAIGDPVKIPETKDEKPSEKASGKEKKQRRASRNDKSEKVGRLEKLLRRSCDMVGVTKRRSAR